VDKENNAPIDFDTDTVVLQIVATFTGDVLSFDHQRENRKDSH